MQAQGIITTAAGGGPNNVQALGANLSLPTGMAVDSAGNQYIAAADQNRLFNVDWAGQWSIRAGSGTRAFIDDSGPATSFGPGSHFDVGLGASRNLYIPGCGKKRIRREDAATGVITNAARNDTQGDSGDGGRVALLRAPILSGSTFEYRLREPTGHRR